MRPNITQMAILKILIEKQTPLKGADIQRTLVNDYRFKVSLGRISTEARNLSHEGFLFSSRSADRLKNGSRRTDYSITEDGKSYYRELRSRYMNYVNIANTIFDLPVI